MFCPTVPIFRAVAEVTSALLTKPIHVCTVNHHACLLYSFLSVDADSCERPSSSSEQQRVVFHPKLQAPQTELGSLIELGLESQTTCTTYCTNYTDLLDYGAS